MTTLREFKEKLETVLEQAGEKKLILQPEFLEDYCRLTGHDYSFYQNRDRVPPGFLMTFTAEPVTAVFIAFFTQFPEVIRGVVHSSSKIKFHAPFRISQEIYRHRTDIAGIVEKTGKKGKHFVVDLELTLLQDDGARVLTDIHQFFLRV